MRPKFQKQSVLKLAGRIIPMRSIAGQNNNPATSGGYYSTRDFVYFWRYAFMASSTIEKISIFTGQLRVQRPQPTQEITPYFRM